MARTLAELQQAAADIARQLRDLQAAAEDAGAYSDEQNATYERLQGEYAQLTNDAGTGLLDRAEAAQQRERQAAQRNLDLGRLSEEAAQEHEDQQRRAAASRNALVSELPETGRVFSSLGEQLQAIAAAYAPAGHPAASLPDMPRSRALELLGQMEAATPSGLSSGVPSDGGVLVQTDFATEIMTNAWNVAVLAPRAFVVEIGANANGLIAPYVDESSRATGSRWGGVRVYRRAEAESVTASRPKFGRHETRLEDLMGLAYATEELLRDAAALGSIMNQAFTEEFAFRIDDEIVRGSGSGEILGWQNSQAAVTVAKEGSQLAATINNNNVTKMYARMMPQSIRRASWYANIDTFPQLANMTLGDQPIFLPPGGLRDVPFGMLLGRPLEYIEQAETLGTVGDISLVDMQKFLLIRKGGVEAATSMHVRFLFDEETFRFKTRINGQPMQKKAVTPYKGAGALSPFVQLATRA